MLTDFGDYTFFGIPPLMENGGYLVRHNGNAAFDVIVCKCSFPNYSGIIQDPCLVAKCTVPEGCLAKREIQQEINRKLGYKKDYIPETKDERMQYATHLTEVYGLWEFNPVFPPETNLGAYCNGIPVARQLTSKPIAERFIRKHLGK